MLNFADRLIEAIEDKNSCVVAGLDPRIESLPLELREKAVTSREAAAEAVLEFNERVIDAVAQHVVAVKPQSAFYEALGWEGVRAYEETIRCAHEHNLLVIGDVKRGDIGTTAEAYAQAHFDEMDADAITVNPYMGTDSIAPFLSRTGNGKGIFVLVKTSNASSSEIQDLVAKEETIYEKAAGLVEKWGAGCRGQSGYSAVGAVVGATFPAAAEKLRKLMPHAIFLLPGYGAQGATAADCARAFDPDGRGAVVNSSRGIIFAFNEKPGAPPWEDMVAAAAGKMRLELESVRTGGKG